MNEWQAKIVERPDLMKSAVYLTQKINGGRVYVLENLKTEFFKDSEIPKVDPFMALLDDDQLAALAEGLSGAGIKTRPVHQLEGTLAAQSAHLEDMRRLVFEPEKHVSTII